MCATGHNFSFAFAVFDENCAVVDLVLFQHLMSKDGAIRHCGDEREGDEEGDDEKINLDLGKISPQSAYLCLCITSYSGQELDDVASARCRIFDTFTHRDICRVNMTGEKSLDGNTACFIGVMFLVNSEWWFKSVCLGTQGKHIGECVPILQAYLKTESLIAAKSQEIAFQRQAAGLSTGDALIVSIVQAEPQAASDVVAVTVVDAESSVVVLV